MFLDISILNIVTNTISKYISCKLVLTVVFHYFASQSELHKCVVSLQNSPLVDF